MAQKNEMVRRQEALPQSFERSSVLLKGLQKTTLIDYPGKVACVVFMAGCNFRCPYCHNPELVEGSWPVERREANGTLEAGGAGKPSIPEVVPEVLEESAFFDFLDKRKKWLDAVVICGGEPTIQNSLYRFAERIKQQGFLVKLDTNGTNPEMLKQLIDSRLIDFIAMDIKAPEHRYSDAAAVPAATGNISKSIALIKEAGTKGVVDYEFRTTVVPGITEDGDVEAIAKWLSGAKKYVIQQFKNSTVLDPSLRQRKPFSPDQLNEFREAAQRYLPLVEVRQ